MVVERFCAQMTGCDNVMLIVRALKLNSGHFFAPKNTVYYNCKLLSYRPIVTSLRNCTAAATSSNDVHKMIAVVTVTFLCRHSCSYVMNMLSTVVVQVFDRRRGQK